MGHPVYDVLGNDTGGCAVVAEISNAHNGDIDRAKRLIDVAIEAGVHAVKFQAYTPNELVALRGNGQAPDPWGSQGWTMRDLYTAARTPLEWFAELAPYVEANGGKWFASVFGETSLTAMQLLGCQMYKLAALDYRSLKLRHMVHDTGKPTIVSVPRNKAPKLWDEAVALYCPAGYPQGPINLRTMVRGKFAGLSYHGTIPLVPALAAAMGARIVEVHIHLADEPSELEANISLDETQLVTLIEATHEVR